MASPAATRSDPHPATKGNGSTISAPMLPPGEHWAAASDEAPRRNGPQQAIDSGRDLSR